MTTLLDFYVQLLTETAIFMIPIIVPAFALWLLVSLISDLLFKQ